MKNGEYEFMVDSVTKFFNSLRIQGWFHHPSDTLKSVRILNEDHVASIKNIGIDHGGVMATFGPGKGFCIQVLKNDDLFDETVALEFTTNNGWVGKASLEALCRDRLRIALHPPSVMMNKFIRMTNKEGIRILDIGGRNRSKNDLSELFGDTECVVLDILPGDNVDVVGDAHEMAKFFPAESFDAIYSVSTFEHILMPWAVVVQMNKVLKPGGIALIFSHQTLAMHDQPWDFWRFSDTSWDALFNEKTGFEILERAMDFEQYVLPYVWRPGKSFEEHAVGYEGSVVLVRKTGPCLMSWDLTPKDITQSQYPANS